MDIGFIIRNTTEDLVEQHLTDCIKRSGVCGCGRCRADIMALALNRLPAHYVATRVGEAYARMNAMNAQSQADIITAIMGAASLVKQHPNH